MLPSESYTGLPVSMVATTATSASTRPISAARSSPNTTSSSLWRDSRNQPPQRASATGFRHFAQTAPPRDRLRRNRKYQHPDGPPGRGQRLGMGQLVEAFIQREQPADAEQDDRDQERPRINRLAIAQRKIGRGRTFGVTQANQQQALIAGIRQRMDGFGQHGAAAGDDRRHALGNRDGQIRTQRENDGLERISAVGHAGTPLRCPAL